MEKAKTKKPLVAFVKKLFGSAVVRGTAKAFPFGSWLYELVATVRAWLRREPLPHSPVSLLVQAVWLFLILYGVFSKEIPVTDALDYFDFSAEDFKHFFAASDTLR